MNGEKEDCWEGSRSRRTVEWKTVGEMEGRRTRGSRLRGEENPSEEDCRELSLEQLEDCWGA